MHGRRTRTSPAPRGAANWRPGVLVALALIAADGLAAAKRPNLLLIVTDNQSASLVGAYGNDWIRTPNIDALAARGTLYTRAFATSGVCSPARATLLTGLLPSQHGVHNGLPLTFRVPDYAALEEFRTLPRTLADAGYATGLVGKYHLGAYERPQLGFEFWVSFAGGHTESFVDQAIVDNGRRVNVRETHEHLTDFWTRRAVDFLEAQSAERPFFLMLSYNGPYVLPPTVLDTPSGPQAEYYRAHPPPDRREPVHPFLTAFAEAMPRDIPIRGGNPGRQALEALASPVALVNVAAETSHVDDGIGRVLGALADSGLADDTLVVFTSDQGSAYGQLGLWGNSSWGSPYPAYEANMRIPLIFAQPGLIPAGRRSDTTVNQFDLLSTLLELLGLDDRLPANSPGRSHARELRGGVPAPEQPAFFEYITTRAMQTRDWKYIKRFLAAPDELYDLAADPGETRNLIESPTHAAVRRELDAALTGFFERHADPQWDVWRGGTAKATLVYGGRNRKFAEHFPGWTPPVTRRAAPFSDQAD